MNRQNRFAVVATLAVLTSALLCNGGVKAQTSQSAASEGTKMISPEDCTSERLGTHNSGIGHRRAGRRSHSCRTQMGECR